MLVRPNKAESAVHGCLHLGDMAVCMPDCGLVFERVTCFYCSKRVTFVVDCVKCVKCVNPHNKNRMTHPYGHDPPLTKGSKTDDPTTLSSGPSPTPILFDQSLTIIVETIKKLQYDSKMFSLSYSLSVHCFNQCLFQAAITTRYFLTTNPIRKRCRINTAACFYQKVLVTVSASWDSDQS